MEECVLVDVVRRKKTGGWKIAALAAQRDAEAGLLPARTGFWAQYPLNRGLKCNSTRALEMKMTLNYLSVLKEATGGTNFKETQRGFERAS